MYLKGKDRLSPWNKGTIKPNTPVKLKITVKQRVNIDKPCYTRELFL